ncbi:MAG: site-specific integrase [Melioribacteraceae bacterium]
MGTIRKTNSGKYQADVRDANGKRIRATFSDKNRANQFILDNEKEKNNHKLTKLGLEKLPTPFPNIIEQAITSKQSLAPKSVTKYTHIYRFFETFLMSESINFVGDFSRNHADKYREQIITSTASVKTKNFYLSVIKSLFQNLVNRDIIVKNPFSHINMERKRNKTLIERENDYYTAKEIISFFKEVKKSHYRNAFYALFLSGMRIEELASLKWQRINLEKRLIEIRTDASFTTKTESSERDIAISDLLFEILNKMNKGTEYVFLSESNTKLNEKKMLFICKDLAKAAGITKNATLHKFRHSFSSHLEQLGVSETVRGYLMGHKPKTMTGHYTKIDPSKLHEHVSKLDSLLINEPTK